MMHHSEKGGQTAKVNAYLDDTVPATRHNDGVGHIGREAHAGHPGRD